MSFKGEIKYGNLSESNSCKQSFFVNTSEWMFWSLGSGLVAGLLASIARARV